MIIQTVGDRSLNSVAAALFRGFMIFQRMSEIDGSLALINLSLYSLVSDAFDNFMGPFKCLV